MKEVKKQGGCLINVKSDKILDCAYDHEQRCNDDCAAFEINKNGPSETVTCLRGSFVVGEIMDNSR